MGRRRRLAEEVIRRARDDGALSTLEMAIFFPVVLLIIMGMFQISLYWHTANSVSVAADVGLDAGQVFPDDHGMAISEAEAAARWILDNTNNSNGEPAATIEGDTLVVSVEADSPRVVGIGSWRVRSVAQGRFEEFVPVNER